VTAPHAVEPQTEQPPAPAPPRLTAAQKLLKIVGEFGVELFRDQSDAPFATVPVTPPLPEPVHWETWPIRSATFRAWLRKQYHAAHDKPPGTDALAQAVGVLEARALFEGPLRDVFTRVGAAGYAACLDLGRPDWFAVEITAESWWVTDRPPVRFRRGRGTAPLPVPVRGGSLLALRRFLPVTDEDWPLVLAWLAACLLPVGPYPVLVIQGEQGSAKSTACRVLRALVDPSAAPLRSLPSDERDLAIHAATNWAITLDNVSAIRPWLADCLCRLATGGGFGTRELYSDDEEVVFTATRPVLLNGIEELTTRDDLRDRALIVTLPPIPDERRRDERTLWAEFDAARPALVGALLSAVSTGLARREHVDVRPLPRMADFARWAVACEPGLGLAPGSFLAAYTTNRRQAVELSLADSPVAQGVVRLVQAGAFEGTASELLTRLTEPPALVPDSDRVGREWPRDARGLSNRLRTLAPVLRQWGVLAEQRRTNGRKVWSVRPLDPFGDRVAAATLPVPATLPSDPAQTLAASEDGANRAARVAANASLTGAGISEPGDAFEPDDGDPTFAPELFE
jgi:hypothetical protein